MTRKVGCEIPGEVLILKGETLENSAINPGERPIEFTARTWETSSRKREVGSSSHNTEEEKRGGGYAGA